MVSLLATHADTTATSFLVALAVADRQWRAAENECTASLANDNTCISAGDRRLRFYQDVDQATLMSEDVPGKGFAILRLVATDS